MTITTQSLVDRFNNIDPEAPYRAKYELIKDLQDLLNDEAKGTGLFPDKWSLLKEYRDNFEWDTEYQVRVDFEVEATLSSEITCTKETFESYLSHGSLDVYDFEMELAKQDKYYMENVENEVYGVNDIKPDIQVRNLRLIPKDYQKFAEAINKVIAEITSIDADTKAKILMEIREKLVQENKVKESEPKTD